jgi:hypothetical protein
MGHTEWREPLLVALHSDSKHIIFHLPNIYVINFNKLQPTSPFPWCSYEHALIFNVTGNRLDWKLAALGQKHVERWATTKRGRLFGKRTQVWGFSTSGASQSRTWVGAFLVHLTTRSVHHQRQDDSWTVNWYGLARKRQWGVICLKGLRKDTKTVCEGSLCTSREYPYSGRDVHKVTSALNNSNNIKMCKTVLGHLATDKLWHGGHRDAK